MNMALRHPADRADVPPALRDPAEPVEAASARIPHVSIHAFAETGEFAAVWRLAMRDRRLVAVTAKEHSGGLVGAVARYGAERSPDLIVIETAAATEAGGDELCLGLDALADACRPETRVIVIGRQNDIGLYRRLLDMGVSAYLVAPVGVGAVIGAIADIYREPGAGTFGRVTAVIGTKGGVGTSTLAQSLALGLSARRGSDVLLIDLDIDFGTTGIDLDLEPNQGVVELLRDPGRIDAEMLDRLSLRHGANLTMLATAARLDPGREIDEAAIDRLLDVAQAHVGRIVLDVPHLWRPWVERALTVADDVVVVATPELASLHNAAALIGRIRALRPNDRAPELVLNQVGMPRRQEIAAKDAARVLEIAPALSIPFDAGVFSAAAARRRMVAEIAGRRPFGRACARLAELIERDEAVEKRRPRRNWLRRRLKGRP